MDKDTARTFRILGNMGVSGNYIDMNTRGLQKKQKEFLVSLPNALALTLQDWSRIPELWALQKPEYINDKERYKREQERIEANKRIWCDSWVSLYDIVAKHTNDGNITIGLLTSEVAETPAIYVLPFFDNKEILQLSKIIERGYSKEKYFSDIYIAKSQLYRVREQKKEVPYKKIDEDISRRALMMRGFYSVGEISFNLNIPVDTVMRIFADTR